jgi:hypothetical protein
MVRVRTRTPYWVAWMLAAAMLLRSRKRRLKVDGRLGLASPIRAACGYKHVRASPQIHSPCSWRTRARCCKRDG